MALSFGSYDGDIVMDFIIFCQGSIGDEENYSIVAEEFLMVYDRLSLIICLEQCGNQIIVLKV